MKNKLLRIFILLVLAWPLFIACRSRKEVLQYYCVIERLDIPPRVKVDNGLTEIKNRYPGYFMSYQKLLDSIQFSGADTVAFLVRPCHIHRGLFIKTRRGTANAYFFNFSNNDRQVIRVEMGCKVAQDFFPAFSQAVMFSETSGDDVLTIPDCPVILFFMSGQDSYYLEIPGLLVKDYAHSNVLLKRLLNKCDSIMKAFESHP